MTPNIIDRTHQYMTNGVWSYRPVEAIAKIVVHHTAVAWDNRSNDERLQSFANYEMHNDNNSWAGLSYHFMVMADGTIYKINELTDMTYSDGINHESLAICFDGYFHPDKNELPTQAQLESGQKLLDWLCNENPQFPASQGDVVGHCEHSANPTACPGQFLLPFILNYRNTGSLVSQLPAKTPVIVQPKLEVVNQKDKNLLVANSNSYYEAIRNNKNTDQAISDLVDRDMEIANLKAKLAKQDDDLSTLHLQAMNLGNSKSTPNIDQKTTPVFEPQHAQTNTANNFIQPTDTIPLIESLRAKITSGHILEIIIATISGFAEYLRSTGFNPVNFTDPKGAISGVFTAFVAYLLIRLQISKN